MLAGEKKRAGYAVSEMRYRGRHSSARKRSGTRISSAAMRHARMTQRQKPGQHKGRGVLRAPLQQQIRPRHLSAQFLASTARNTASSLTGAAGARGARSACCESTSTDAYALLSRGVRAPSAGMAAARGGALEVARRRCSSRGVRRASRVASPAPLARTAARHLGRAASGAPVDAAQPRCAPAGGTAPAVQAESHQVEVRRCRRRRRLAARRLAGGIRPARLYGALHSDGDAAPARSSCRDGRAAAGGLVRRRGGRQPKHSSKARERMLRVHAAHGHARVW